MGITKDGKFDPDIDSWISRFIKIKDNPLTKEDILFIENLKNEFDFLIEDDPLGINIVCKKESILPLVTKKIMEQFTFRMKQKLRLSN